VTGNEFGEYLRLRRGMITAAQAGVIDDGRRRVPGLRRDEVAHRVAVSVDYYTRLEQGRVGRPSDSVLEALARTLELGPAEHAHLYDLAAPIPTKPAAKAVRTRRRVVRPELSRIVERVPGVPAVIMDDHTEIICWNPLAAALLGGEPDLSTGPQFMARLLFLDPLTAARHLDWDTAARDTVGILRMAAGRDPHDPALAALIGELSLRSDAFRHLWASHHVHEKTHGTKAFHHPDIGDIHLDYESFRVPGPEHYTLVLYTPAPDSPAQDALTLLSRLIADANDGDSATGGSLSVPVTRPETAREA
jgi:transcriptional regulator with XRE-family HTH domain